LIEFSLFVATKMHLLFF